MKWIRLIKIVFVFIGVLLTLTGGCLNVCEWPNQIAHRIDLPSTIQPDHPKILEFNEEIDKFWNVRGKQLKEQDYSPNKIIEKELDRIEFEIGEKIDYCPEIENPDYAAFEHFPTIDQALENGDDCDGMAIVACSLLIHRGYDSYVILNDRHAWVITYLDDGSFIEILKNPIPEEDYNWLIQWNDHEIKINFSHPIPLLVIGLVLLFIMRKWVMQLSFNIRRLTSTTSLVKSSRDVIVKEVEM